MRARLPKDIASNTNGHLNKMESCQSRNRSNRRPAGTAALYLLAAYGAYLLSLGPASALKTSGAVDPVPSGCQLLDAYAGPGLGMLMVPGFGGAYEAYLRWWDDLDEPN